MKKNAIESYRVIAAYVTAKITREAAAGVVVTGFYKDAVIPADVIDPEDRDRLLEKGMLEGLNSGGEAVEQPEVKAEPEPKPAEPDPEPVAKHTLPGSKPKGNESGGGN